MCNYKGNIYWKDECCTPVCSQNNFVNLIKESRKKYGECLGRCFDSIWYQYEEKSSKKHEKQHKIICKQSRISRESAAGESAANFIHVISIITSGQQSLPSSQTIIPFTSIFKKKTKSPRMNRWILELREYNYVVQYVQGKENHVVGNLSQPVRVIQRPQEPIWLGKTKEEMRTYS